MARALALILPLLIAFGAAAQSAEFGRATGGELVLTPKGTAPFSGSLELALSNGAPAYGLTAGGTLVQDRLWFFASASRQEGAPARYQQLELPQNATSSAIGGRVSGQLGASHDFGGFFEAARRPELSTTAPASFTGNTLPSSFLSLRYTGIVSSNMFFTANISRSEGTAQRFGIVPAP
ncbi:MAG TPA: hypothetical protein VF618_08960 [Thermoanaerobaculia bacterium]